MIIRRLVEAIRRQDWFVVGVEIMIVVIGIFIALQVNNWNDGRKNIKLEREYLERMQAEFDRLLEVEEGRLRWNTIRIKQGFLVKDVLESGDLSADGKANFEYGLYFLGVINRPRLSWGTVDELRSTGNIQLIRDLSLRQALTDMENEFQWTERILNDYSGMAMHYREEINKRFRVVQSPDAPGSDGSLVLDYDLAALASDETFKNMVARVAVFQVDADDFLRTNLARLSELRDQIAQVRQAQFGDGEGQ